MNYGFQQEDIMNDTILPDSILLPPTEKIDFGDHLKYAWKRCKQLGFVIGNKVLPTTDNNSLFIGKNSHLNNVSQISFTFM